VTLLDDVVARLRAAGCVFAEEEGALLLDAVRRRQLGDVLEELVARRVAGEPLEHLLGWAAFAGRRWSVGPGVFVPRRRTELMVRAALAALARREGRLVVVDLCCGCGAVGGAVLLGLRPAHARHDGGRPDGGAPRVTLHASDVDPATTAHARVNLEPLGAVVHTGDLLDPLPTDLEGRVDVLLCNAPYVPTDAIATMPPEARDHEPTTALDGGPDGLDMIRRVVAAAPGWLRPGTGRLLFEVSPAQAPVAVALAANAGLRAVVVHDDPDDEPTGGTVVVATHP
jgi:release factor glutamine methyltransferase